MRQLYAIASTQALLWYVLFFGGTAFYADYMVMALNVLLLISAVVIGRATLLTSNEDFILGNVRSGVVEPSGPITTYASMIHAAIAIFLFASNEWWFGTATWIVFAAVFSSSYSRSKRLLIPEIVDSAKLTIKLTDKYMEGLQKEQELNEIADDMMKQIKIITDAYDAEAAANKDENKDKE